MKLFHLLLVCISGAAITCPNFIKAQSTTTMQQSLNMIAFEHREPYQYAIVSYMPYYPAYGMISIKSHQCNAEIAGYIDPFALKQKKIVITYKTCKVSFDISQDDKTLSNPTETKTCQEYHPKECNFAIVPNFQKISLNNHS